MSAINEYPNYKSIEELPYTIKLRQNLEHAKQHQPHRVEYHEKMLKGWLRGPIDGPNHDSNHEEDYIPKNERES